MRITELDFEQIKENLRGFLKDKEEFKDFDSEGSSISYLINLLSANTLYNAFYLHMISNEMFLDTAQDRKNIVSRAKAVGYVPYSAKSSIAFVEVTFFPNPIPQEIFVPERTRFTSTLDNKTFHFHTREAYTVTPDNEGVFKKELKLHEGIPLTHKYKVDSQKYFPEDSFLIPNPNVDTSLLAIRVQKSEEEPVIETFFPNKDITEITSEDRVYFINETVEKKFEISFGNGVIGKKLENGNIVIIDYVISSGKNSNKCNAFSATSSVGGVTNVIVKTVSKAAGGKDSETDDSVRFLAPLSYQSQNRMVTKTDYETLIVKEFPAIDSIRVWGGEENFPYPEYGKVFVSIKPSDGFVVSDSLKKDIINRIIKPKNMVSIEVEIKEPFFIFLEMDIEVNFDTRKTNDTEIQVRQVVRQSVLDYSQKSLSKFEKDFQFSKFISQIASSHPSIENVVVKKKLRNRLVINTQATSEYRIDFSNRLDSSIDPLGNTCLNSDAFLFNGFHAFLKDDGLGNILVYRIVEGKTVTITKNVGEIDYQRGIVFLKKFYTPQILSGNPYLEISVNPYSVNISSARNQILLIDEAYLKISMNDISIR